MNDLSPPSAQTDWGLPSLDAADSLVAGRAANEHPIDFLKDKVGVTFNQKCQAGSCRFRYYPCQTDGCVPPTSQLFDPISVWINNFYMRKYYKNADNDYELRGRFLGLKSGNPRFEPPNVDLFHRIGDFCSGENVAGCREPESRTGAFILWARDTNKAERKLYW
jgi:hypothetical protein